MNAFAYEAPHLMREEAIKVLARRPMPRDFR